jgi:hypothetical protein
MRKLIVVFLKTSLFFLLPCEGLEFKYTLSIGAIFQNEAPYMREWIEYHKLVGVEHFILYNNNSTDHYLEVLDPYIKEGVVELIEWPSNPEEDDWLHFSFTIQTNAYNDAINKSKNCSKWIALIDIDEFIIPVIDSSLPECLEKRYPHVSGVNINWQCYGTSHIQKLDPSIPMTAQLVMKIGKDHKENQLCKSIVQPVHVETCTNPHFCRFIPPHYGTDTKFRPCEGCSLTIEIDVLRINHYWTKDVWFLSNVKLPRHQKWGGTMDTIMNRAGLMNEERDEIMMRFVPDLIEGLEIRCPGG